MALEASVRVRYPQAPVAPRVVRESEEAVVVTEAVVTIQLGEETIVARAGSIVRIPPGVPHALRNQAPDSARGLGAAAWNQADFFREATTYLEGAPPTD